MSPDKKYLVGLILIMAVFIITEIVKPKPLDWSETYLSTDRIPYGTFIFHEHLKSVYSGDIIYNRDPVFELDSTKFINPVNWFFIDRSITTDPWEGEILLERIRRGDVVFIASRNFEGFLSDSLGFSLNSYNPIRLENLINSTDSTSVNFTHPEIKTSGGFTFVSANNPPYFQISDSTVYKPDTLGFDDQNNPNFIKYKIGEGSLILHSNPYLFTNFYTRNIELTRYALDTFSYLDDRTLIWDEYYKSASVSGQGMMSFILSQYHLKWAWFLSLSAVLVFFVFNSRRKQKAIPEQSAPRNTTVEYASNIAGLYFERKAHREIAIIKTRYFKNVLLRDYGIEFEPDNTQFQVVLSNRSGVDQPDISALLSEISKTNEAENYTVHDLKKLNYYLNRFYKNSN